MEFFQKIFGASRDNFDNRNLSINILVTLIICVVLFLFISSAIFYINFERMALELVYSDNMLNLKQTSRAVSVMGETGLRLAGQIFRDINIQKLQLHKSPDVYDLSSAFAQLNNYRLSASFIESIYVYNGKNQKFYLVSGTTPARESIQSVSDFDDPQIIGMINDYEKYPPHLPVPRRPAFRNARDSKEFYTLNYYTFFVYNFLNQDLNSAVFVNINEDWIHRVIDSDEKKQGDTFIIDSSGRLVSNTAAYPMLTNLADLKHIQKVLGEPDSSGYFVESVNGVKMLVSYTPPDGFGWRYIRITPLKTIMNKINNTRFKTALVSITFLICGLLAAYLISRQLYRPIRRMLSDYQYLETAKKSSDLALKQEYLRNVILGHGGTIADLKSPEYEDLKINVIPENPCWLLLFKVDEFANFSLKYKPEEKSLIKNAMIYLTMENFKQQCHIEAVDLGNDTLVFILNAFSPTGELEPESVREQIRKTQAAILEKLQVSVSVIISSGAESALDLNVLYNQTVEASLHRLFHGRGCIIFAEIIAGYKSKEYVYPTNKEKILVDALMGGNTEEAKNIYLEIIGETVEYPFAAFNLAISHLIITINNTLNIIQKNNLLTDYPPFKLSSAILNDLETIEEINLYFFILFESIKETLERKKSSKQDHLVKKIQEIVDGEYPNPDLSVDNIAATLELTPSYICRVYKQHTLKTILDYIVEVRMNKAKELLLQTKLPVAEIAEKVGFANSSYFYKTFKKMNGVTPNDFRSSEGWRGAHNP